MPTPRSRITDFIYANPAYVNATVAFYLVDENGVRTETLAPLYAATTGTARLENPQRLGSRGQFQNPVYHEDSVIGVVESMGQPTHTTGIINNAQADADRAEAAANSILDDAGFQAVAANLSGPDTIGIVADDIASVVTVGIAISQVVATGNSIANVNTVAGSIANVNSVADSIVNVNLTGSNIDSINTVAGIALSIPTVADIAADVTATADISEHVVTVSGIADKVTIAADNDANITTVADDIGSVIAVANGIDNIALVSGSINNVNAVGADIAKVVITANAIDSVIAVADVADDVTALAPAANAMINLSGIADQFGDLSSIATDAAASADSASASATTATTQASLATDAAIAAAAAASAAKIDPILRINPRPIKNGIIGPVAGYGPAPYVDFSRSTTAYTVDERGLLTTAAIDVLRQYYDTTGLLWEWIEGAGTNKQPYSRLMSAVAWTASGGGSTDNSSTGADGAMTASTFTEDTNSGVHGWSNVSGYRPTGTATDTHVYQFFISKDTSRRYVICGAITGFPTSSGPVLTFDTVTGTITQANAPQGGTYVSSGIYRELKHGWVVWISGKTGSDGGAVVFLRGTLSSSGNTANTEYLGDGSTISGGYVDVKTGTFPTSYVETTTASAIRDADTYQITLSDLAEFPTGGERFGYFDTVQLAEGIGSLSQNISTFDDGTLNNLVGLYRNGASQLILAVVNGGATIASIFGPTFLGAQNIRYFFNAETDNFWFALAVEGVDLGNGVGAGKIYGPDTSGAMPNVTTFNRGNRSDQVRPAFAKFGTGAFYRAPVSQAEAISLVSW